MQQVMVRISLEGHSPLKRFAAEYVRSNGERVPIAKKQRSSTHVRDRAAEIVRGIEWKLSVPEAPTIDEGQGWIDELDPDPLSAG